MALTADKEGFLTGGKPANLDVGGYSRALSVLQAIKGDTAAIRKSIGEAVVTTSRMTRAANSSAFTPKQTTAIANAVRDGAVKAARTTPNRGADGRFVATNKQRAVAEKSTAKAVAIGTRAAHKEASENAKKQPRGDDGKFGGGSKGGGGFGLSRGSGLARDAAIDAGETVAQVDAVGASVKEVASIAAPFAKAGAAVFRGGASLFGGKKKEEKEQEKSVKKNHVPWYKKIVKAIENRPSGGRGDGVGPLGRMKNFLAGAAGSALGMAGSVIGAIAKRFPLLAKLATPLATMFSAVKSFNTSTEDYAKRFGMEGGTFFSDLGIRLMGTFQDLGNTLTFGLAGKLGEVISPAINDGVDWIKKKFGDAADAIKEKVVGAKDAAVNFVTERAESTKDYWGGKAQTVKDTVSSLRNKSALTSQMNAAGITDPKERAMFMAQMDHESGGFKSLNESFKYRSADQIMAVSGTARVAGKDAVNAAMAKGDSAVAELMYGGRMGNTEAGDGYKYRGRGFTQLTGKANYAEAGKALGIDLANNPDLAADPANAAKIATWYWKSKGLSGAAKAGDVSAVTKGINGGLNGLDHRSALYAKYSASGGAASPTMPIAKVAQTAALAVDKLSPSAAPSTTQALASNKKADKTVVVMSQPVGQNIGDRSIAQLVTGGMGTNT